MAPGNGRSIEATAIQIFTRSQRQWKAKPMSRQESGAFRRALGGSGVKAVLSHASYLINLSSVVPQFLALSRKTLAEELRRCHALGIPHAVVHPGAHMGAGEKQGLAAVARSLDDVLRRTRGSSAGPLLEVTAGQGSCLGHSFEQVAEILARVKDPRRVGVCLDTCHLFAAGYDITTERGYEQTLERFDRVVGLRKLKAIHLNDSQKPLGSRVDRHEHVGDGCLGLEPFRRIVNDRRFSGLPMLLETPKTAGRSPTGIQIDPLDERNLTTLRSLIAASTRGTGTTAR
jgi:deoxyribonuclease-4